MGVGDIALQILQENGIECVTTGKNVRPGNFAIPCPWCGDDPSQHLSIRLDKGVYACWRGPDHKGGKVEDVLVAVLGWTQDKARQELRHARDFGSSQETSSEELCFDNLVNTIYTQPSVLDSQARTSRVDTNINKGVSKLEFQHFLKSCSFKDIIPDGRTKPYWDYVQQRRGFGRNAAAVIARYDLKACLVGAFAGRLIIPFIESGQWVSFIARAIRKAELRYKTLENTSSLVPPRQTIFNHDTVSQGGKMLVITEGPLDAMKVDFYGRALGVCGTCTYTVTASEHQRYKLQLASKRFKYTVVILDKDFELQALSMASQIGSHVVVEPFRSQDGSKDFGDMSGPAVQKYLKQILHWM